MSFEDITGAGAIAVDDDASSVGSLDSDKTIRPGFRRTMSAINLSASPDDDVFAPSSSSRGLDVNKTFEAMTKAVGGSFDQENQPRSDRGLEITRENAQGQCPADACLFVANLVDDEPETQLEATLHEMLDDFGRNWIQVKKDRQAHPYAIVQFEKVEAAHDALRNGKGMVLNGRNIRLEKAKVERSVIVTSLAGIGPLTEHEACNMMARFGPIEIIASTDLISDRSTALSRGQYVKFHFWLDCRDALRKFHDHYPNFRIQLASGVEPKMRAFTKSGASIVTGLSRTRANVDVRSIFLGNLPSDVAKNEIFELFGRFGQIQELSLVRKPFPGGLMNTFAFVEFSTAIEANVAAESEVSIRGTKIRIEPKEYTARRKSRLALEASPPASMPATPRPRFASPVRSERTPFRISPAANAALQERLAQNNMVNNALADNFGDRAPNVYTPPQMRGGLGRGGRYTNPYNS